MKFQSGMTLRETEKLRPIGSPDLASSVISKSFTDMITFMYEKGRPNSQHGYRPEKGVHTVIQAIVNKYMENKNKVIIEYDFKSYFNRISLL